MSPPDPTEKLLVIDRLDVGPPRLERQRLLATYTVSQDGRTDSFDFSYRFEEDVFDPDDPAASNLGSMMAAQIALNYGLFCREIVLHGSFDRADRRFLRDMAENTAREIYVKKFLEHNPFLKGAAANLPAVPCCARVSRPRTSLDRRSPERPGDLRSAGHHGQETVTQPVPRDSYLAAELLFPGGDAPLRDGRPAVWKADQGRVALLASGGKESLLTFSLLREAGCDVHNVFVNESGKHWFTALNAYRHFREHVPNTARVWTNSDRLFSWMLRRLPFIREDFPRVRSDEYPIRLWTVAVFLFGALPLLRKRGIGRLAIGDEFDTTDKRTDHGIPHYNGLYDQSRFFDQAMSRYFAGKAWNVSQFSLVRPLSELLVEKVLLERYPEIQRLQTSCHAAHKNDDRVRPCGQCEKCTRVVSMLAGLGGDATACGYTPAQVDNCLRNFARRGAMQEGPALEHLAFLLAQQKPGFSEKAGFLSGGAAKPREHPEIMKLRFDPKRSPIEDVPVDLRQPVYRILLEHANGAVRRSGRRWVDFDVLSSDDIARPYKFETPRSVKESPMPKHDGSKEKSTYLLGELTWPEAERRFQEVDVAMLPVGAIEQHGPHLPLDTDAYDAELLCREVAQRASEPRPIVLPLIPYGVSYHHDDFTGTISIGPDTLSRLIYEVGMSVVRQGIAKLVIVNGHGGNVPALQFAAQLINRDGHVFTCVDSGETSDADVEALAETPGDVHAGEIETSTSLANRPHLVQMKKAKKFVPRFSSHYLEFSSKRSVDWYARTEKISPTGVLGDPTKASREKGEKMWSLMVGHLLALIEDLKSMSLDEIHQKSPY